MALDILKLRGLQAPADLSFKIAVSVMSCPDDHCLEIYWGFQIGTSVYVRPASEWKGIKTLEAAIANPV